MAQQTVSLRCVGMEAISADLDLLSRAAKTSAELHKQLLGLVDSGAQLVLIGEHPLPADGTNSIRFALQLSERLRELVAAVRAGNFDAQ